MSSFSQSISSSLLGDRSSYQRLSGATEGARGHHFCPSWRPQLPGRSQGDGRSWYVVLLSISPKSESMFRVHILTADTCWVIMWFCWLSSGKTTGIPIHVFGTETHMTAIVGMALGHRPIPNLPPVAAHTANFLLNSSGSTSVWHTRSPRRQIGCRDVVPAHCAVLLHHRPPPVLWSGLVSSRPACHRPRFIYCLILLVSEIARSPAALLCKRGIVHCSHSDSCVTAVGNALRLPRGVH